MELCWKELFLTRHCNAYSTWKELFKRQTAFDGNYMHVDSKTVYLLLDHDIMDQNSITDSMLSIARIVSFPRVINHLIMLQPPTSNRYTEQFVNINVQILSV